MIPRTYWQSISKRWVLLALLLLIPTLPTAAQADDAKARISAVLLTTPDRCADPCIWTLQPGVATRDSFTHLTADLFPAAKQAADDTNDLSAYAEGVGLYAYSFRRQPTDPITEYVMVRVQPAVAQAAGYDTAHFTPIAMINALGNPDDAYLMIDRYNWLMTKADRYRLILVYRERRAVYVILGEIRDYRVCLVSDAIEMLSLYRFSPRQSNGRVVGQQVSSLRYMVNGVEPSPPSISTNTNQTAADFTRMAASPDTDCLTFK